MKHRKFLLPILILLVAVSLGMFWTGQVPLAHGAVSNLLYINPPTQGPVPAGTTVTYSVKVANMAPFNGWDIQVSANPSAINPAGVSATGNLLTVNFTQSVTEFINCVNGGVGFSFGLPGNMGCTLGDGPGVVHDAVIISSKPPMTTPVSGLLFKFNYTSGSQPSSIIHIFNDLISNGGSTGVTHTDQDGTYDTPADYSISANPTALTLYQGGPVGASAASAITVTSLHSLSGGVTFSASVGPSGFPKVFSLNTPDPSGVTLSAGTSATTTLTVSTNGFTAPGNYIVVVTGSSSQPNSGFPSGILTHSVTIMVTVKPGNLVYINPVQQGPFATSFTYQVKVANMQPFTGWDIAVKVDTAAISPSSLTISENLFAANFSSTMNELINCVNNVGTNCVPGEDGVGIVHSSAVISGPKPTSLPSSGLLFTITYAPAAKVRPSIVHVFADQIFDGSPTPVPHFTQDGLYSTPADFIASADPFLIILQPGGGTRTSAFTLISLNGFAGAVSVKTSTLGNASIAARPTVLSNTTSITLAVGGTRGATLTIMTTTSTPTGKYAVVVNATGLVGVIGHSVFTKITVVVADFGLSASPRSLIFLAGGSGFSTITVTSINGYADIVALSSQVTGGTCPTNCPTADLAPASAILKTDASQPAGLSVSSSLSTPSGLYTITVTGTGSVLTHTTTVALTVQVQPTITTVLKDSAGASVTTVPVGTSVHDTATLAGATGSAGGTVTYAFFDTSSCTGTRTVVSTEFVNSGIVHDSAVQPFPTVGSFSWNAVYSGDSINRPATSSCEPLTVTGAGGKASPTITTVIKDSTNTPVTSIPVGTSVHDNSTLTGATATAGGTVTYAFWKTIDCTGTGTLVSTVTVTNGIVPDSAAVTFSSAGPFSFNATYSGDANNNPATSLCEPLSVKAAPTIATIIKDSTGATITSVTVGSAVHDTATLTGATSTAGGSVTYTIFSNSGCTSSGTTASMVTVTNAAVPDSAPTVPAPAGAYSFKASYTGDANNSPATSPCEPLTVNKASPTIATVIKDPTNAAVTSITVGTMVHDTATLTNSFQAGGSVTYTIFSNVGCTSPGTTVSTVTVTGGVVPDSTPTTPSPAGPHSFHASYTGDVNNNMATSPCEPLTVNRASPTIATTLSATTITVGGSVTDSSALTGSFQAGGTVTYEFFTGSTCAGTATTVGTPVTVTGGVVADSASQAFNSAGAFSWNAVYSGDANNNRATSPCEPLTVKASPTIATVIRNSTNTPVTTVVVGTAVHDTATLTGATSNAGGSVAYTIFTDSACTAPGTTVSTVTVTNGVVPDSSATTPSPQGSYSLRASYSGDTNNNAATSTCEPLSVTDFTLTATPTTLSIPAGFSGSAIISVTSVNGFTSSLDLTTSTLPMGFLAQFLPNPLVLTTPGTSTSTLTIFVAPTVAPSTITFAAKASTGPLQHEVTITVVVTAPTLPTFSLHKEHHLSLAEDRATQTWHGTILNPGSTSIVVLIEITAHSLTNPALTFDITCDATHCVNTVGSPATTPGLTPITIGAVGAATFSAAQSIPSNFQSNKFCYTGTLFFGSSVNGPVTAGISKSGCFSVVP